jgi:hypothetical protein
MHYFFYVQHYLEKLFLFFHLTQIRVEETRFETTVAQVLIWEGGWEETNEER